MRNLLATIFTLAALPAAAQLPMPGSTYHLLFATSEFFRTTSSAAVPPSILRFGNIAGADWQVTNSAFNASLPGTLGWDGVAQLYHSILSISGDNAASRLSVAGPVYNVHGELLATGLADLFDGNMNAVNAVGYNEYGETIVENPQAWTGSTSIGVWVGSSCSAWNSTSSGTGGRVGSAIDPTSNWLNTGANRPCNLSARLYGLSPALIAPLWGDYDGSGAVDGGDLLEWQRQLGQAPSAIFSAGRAFTANATQSPIVNAADLAVWQAYFGQSITPTAPVPEPAAWALAFLGLPLLFLRLPPHRGEGAGRNNPP